MNCQKLAGIKLSFNRKDQPFVVNPFNEIFSDKKK